VLVVGGFGIDGFTDDPASSAALRRIAEHARRTASVCTGARALARAGLLDG
jgi:transcriptional regulator GlxA family with amidase domain